MKIRELDFTNQTIYVSRKSLLKFKTHGFYRFFVFESCLLLALLNLTYLIKNPFSVLQIVSWILLIVSIYLVFKSLFTLKTKAGSEERENARPSSGSGQAQSCWKSAILILWL